MRPDPSAELWRFSLAVYGRAGVANALIGLQDRLGVDVNLVLYCLWCGCSGRAMGAADIKAAVQATRRWQIGTVRPLRDLRRSLKQEVDGIESHSLAARVARLREDVKRAELRAERIEQRMLGRLARGPGAQISRAAAAAAARTNLRLYLSSRGQRATTHDRTAIAHVIVAATARK